MPKQLSDKRQETIWNLAMCFPNWEVQKRVESRHPELEDIGDLGDAETGAIIEERGSQLWTADIAACALLVQQEPMYGAVWHTFGDCVLYGDVSCLIPQIG